MQTQDRPYRSADIVRFLRLLLRRIRGPLLVIWDGASVYTGQPVRDLLAQGAAWGLLVARLPGYAPDLNPDEGVWNHLKRVELGNVCCADLPELAGALRRAKERLCHKRAVLQAGVWQAGYQV